MGSLPTREQVEVAIRLLRSQGCPCALGVIRDGDRFTSRLGGPVDPLCPVHGRPDVVRRAQGVPVVDLSATLTGIRERAAEQRAMAGNLRKQADRCAATAAMLDDLHTVLTGRD